MSKYYHPSEAERGYNEIRGEAPFHYGKMLYQASESMGPRDIQKMAAGDDLYCFGPTGANRDSTFGSSRTKFGEELARLLQL